MKKTSIFKQQDGLAERYEYKYEKPYLAFYWFNQLKELNISLGIKDIDNIKFLQTIFYEKIMNFIVFPPIEDYSRNDIKEIIEKNFILTKEIKNLLNIILDLYSQITKGSYLKIDEYCIFIEIIYDIIIENNPKNSREQ